MKSHLLTATLALCALAASADITVNYPSPAPGKTIVVSRGLISNLAEAKTKDDLKVSRDTLAAEGNSIKIATPADGDYRFKVAFDDKNSADLYSRPGENLVLTVTQFNPIRYSVSGSPLMEGMSEMMTASLPIEEAAIEIQQGKRPQTEMQKLFEDFIKIYTDYIEKNPASPASVFAMLSLQPETFDQYDAMVAPTASQSALYPMYKVKQLQVKSQLAADKKRTEMAANQVQAPDFSLPNLEGKKVSLGEFKGKWVILDFWGSWCGWCIKGFPELKAAYEKYKPELEVIGIDCQETPERWKAGVAKYQLPWVHVYLSKEEQDALLSAYGVQGFPTKIIINPEGKIMNITSGEDPAFYTTLASLMGK